MPNPHFLHFSNYFFLLFADIFIVSNRNRQSHYFLRGVTMSTNTAPNPDAKMDQTHFLVISDQAWNQLNTLAQKDHCTIEETFDNIIDSYLVSDFDFIRNQLTRALEIIEKMRPKDPVPFTTVGEMWIEEKRANDRSSSVRVIKNPYTCHLIPALGDRNIGDITRQDILDYQARLAQSKSVDTVNRVIKTLKQIFRTALKNELIDKDPCEFVDYLKQPKSDARDNKHRALDGFEYSVFIDAASEEHLRDFSRFCKSTGVRQGEAAALTASDIDENFIYISRTLMTNEEGKLVMGEYTKTHDSKRKIPINRTIKEILEEQVMPTDGSTIFKGKRGGFVTDKAINDMIRRTTKRLRESGVEIADFTCHAFRDTFATDYVRAHRDCGGDAKTLQSLMGHSSMGITTDLYVHSLDDSMVEGMRTLDVTVA